MLINAEEVIRELLQNRQAWIHGYNGSHKTSLAWRLAYELKKRKHINKIFSNNQSIWSDDIKEQTVKVDGAIILDEGGYYIDSRDDVKEFTAMARKLEVYYLIPSYIEPPKGMRNLEIFPLFTLMDAFVPIIFYMWKIGTKGSKSNGYFAWWNPQEIYGVYSTKDPGSRTTQLLKEVQRIADNQAKQFGHDDRIRTLDFTSRPFAEVIEEAMEKTSRV